MPPSTPIDTAKVQTRRTLIIRTPAELAAEVDRITASARAGTLTAVGNWTPGQILGHLAAWMNYGYDGFPTTPPWFIKIVLRLLKRRFFGGKGLPAGVRIPGAPEGTYGTEVLPLEEGERRFKAAFARLQAGPPAKPHPIFGPLTHQQWWSMHLAHAQLHLSFLIPHPTP